MSHLALISALIAFAGLAFSFTGVRRLFQRRYLNAIGLQFSALFVLLVASGCFLLASNLYTYQRLVFEQVVAEVSFQKLASQEYSADIKALNSGIEQKVNLKGDEWQLDTQVLTWRGVANMFGLDANYRLHQISGRYLDLDEEQSHRSVVSLTAKPAYVENEKFDLWPLAHKYQDWLHWVEVAYDSAVFLPMTDGAKYQVAISRNGLVARPANSVARKAVSQWISLK